MSFCRQCGTKQSEGANFCFSCGATQASTDSVEINYVGADLYDLAVEIAELYVRVRSDDNFDPESISEEIFVAVTYSELVRNQAAIPTASGAEIMKLAKKSLAELVESLDEED